jgi:GDP/UDP-N,N'-diacetylbacillosamine 2-epimerase (hydrolysing)
MRESLLTSTSSIDIMIIPADRQEMMGCAYTCFQLNIPIAHFLAGSAGSGIHDEVIRFMFSRMAYIQFCQTPEDAKRLVSMGEEKWRPHMVGTTAFDDLVIEDEYKPKFEYDLILYHSDTISFPQIYIDLKKMDDLCCNTEHVFVLYPNDDHGSDLIRKWIDKLEGKVGRYVIKESLPRSRFLCLLKHANRFIGNSSSGVYEAPYFKTPFINIGKRNQYRKTKIITGASDKIVEILENLIIRDEGRRKLYHE